MRGPDDDASFTVEEANAELAELRERLPRLRDARRRPDRTSERITDAVAADGGGVAGSDWFRHQQTLKTELEYLAERGILLRDPETGLIDFPAERDGEPVFLCWRLGEDEVAWYHGNTRGSAAGSRYDSDAVPVVVVVRRDRDEPPPEIEPAGTVAELRYAPDARARGGDRRGRESSSPGVRSASWRRVALATEARWVQSASDGVDGLLFPELVGERRRRHERAGRVRRPDRRMGDRGDGGNRRQA